MPLDLRKHQWKINLERIGSVGSEKQRFGGDYQAGTAASALMDTLHPCKHVAAFIQSVCPP